MLPVTTAPSCPVVKTLDVGMAQPIVAETKTNVNVTPVTTSTSTVDATTTATSIPTVAQTTVTDPSSSSVPIVVVNTPQAVRAYDGSMSWSSFKDHFTRK